MLRSRTVLAAGAGLLLVVGLAGPAFATEEPSDGEATEANYASEADEECAHMLAEGGSIDDCQEAPNPLLPEPNELIWGTIFFAVVAFVLIKFAVPALRKGLQAREDKIRADLEGAESAKTESERALAEYRTQIAGARAEADRIIDEARQQAETVRQELMTRAEAEAAEARSRTEADLDAAVNRLRGDLQAEVSRVAIELAEKIVERNLDGPAQQALIERYIAEVGGLGSQELTMSTSSIDTRIAGWAEGVLAIARAEGRTEALADELFQVARALEANEALRRTLVDDLIPIDRREAIVADLLGGRGALRLTQSVVSFVLAAGRGSQLPEIIDELVRQAAASRSKVVAEVRSAVPLDPGQLERLRGALARSTGRDVEIRAVVDPDVLGGVVAKVGDTVIDGSVRGRLRKLRESV